MTAESPPVAVVAGGMGGVGRATAIALAREHYCVAVLYKQASEDEIAEVRASLPGEHLFLQCNVSNEQETARAIDEVLSRIGRIDAAVYTAVDPIRRERILDMNETGFRSQFEAGFFGAFNFFKPLANIMKNARRGTLIGITSSVVESPATPARTGAYTVGKIALRGLLRELHRELSPSGVRVFAVAPGLMRTQLNADLPEKFFEMAAEHQGARTLMTPADVADTIVRLCSDPDRASGASYLVSSGERTSL